MRLVDALDQATRSADTPATVGEVRATFAWAIAPQDATEPEELVQRADERLILRKQQFEATSVTHRLVGDG
jgi:hypothetical protein